MTKCKKIQAKDKKTPEKDEENILASYLKDINKIPLLTREEEKKYALLARQGDEDARNKILNANLRFVVNVAKKYQNQGLPLTDLISEGNIGLMKAVERFDADKGYHFISYAVWWIRQAILKAICDKSRLIRLPLNRANELVQIERTRKYIQCSMTEDREIHEIAKTLNMKASLVADLVNASRDLVSLESPVYVEKDSSILGDFIEDTRYELPEDSMLAAKMKDDIERLLATLSRKEAEILKFRYGLSGKNSLSLKELGDRFNLTKERIRQIEKKAVRKLQHPKRRRFVESYV